MASMSQEPKEDPNLCGSLRDVGQNVERVLALAASPEVLAVYKGSTDGARKAGVFGSPTFTTSGELFWGDDRIEDAVSWHFMGLFDEAFIAIDHYQKGAVALSPGVRPTQHSQVSDTSQWGRI
jgi:hypothetical protein